MIFVSNIPPSTAYEKDFLTLAAGMLVFLTVMGILFSFSSPSQLRGVSIFGEGLVPYEMSQEEYKEVLEWIIDVKEEILSRMRNFVGFGLVSFMTIAAISFFSPIFTMALPGYFNGAEAAIVRFIQELSYSLLLVFLAILALTFAGRFVLGLISSDDDYEEE